MKFGYLVIENFFRIKSLSINLANPGLYAVLGRNEDTGESNEAGKSTIFEALCWCLWGRYASGGARAGDEVVNPEVGSNCYVSVEIWDGEDRYIIVRTRNHTAFGNQLCIEKENLEGHDYKEVIPLTARNVRSTTQLVETILGMNYETFVRGYYFPQEGVQSFGSMTDRHLKDFFLTELLDLSWIGDAYDNTKVHKKELEYNILGVQNTVSNLKDSLDNLQARIVECNLKGDSWKEERKTKLKELGKEIKNEKDKLQTIKENSEAIVKKIQEFNQAIAILRADRDWNSILQKASAKFLIYSTEIASLEPKIESIKAEIEKYTSQLEQIGELPGNTCEACGSLLDHGHIKYIQPRLLQQIRDLKSQLLKLTEGDKKGSDSYTMKVRELDALKREIEALKAKIEVQKEHDEQIVKFKEKLTSLESAANVEFIQRIIDDRKKQMAQKAKEKNPYIELVNEDAEKIEETTDKINRLYDDNSGLSEQLSEVEFWLHAFSTQGIQSYVLDNVTRTLNRLIARNLLDLSDGRISARFETVTKSADGTWKEKFKLEVNNMDGGSTYVSLSGGAKRRVDLGASLGVSEYKRSLVAKELDFLVFDESTANMDTYWTERFISLIKNRLTNSSKYFITHQHLDSSWFDDEIVVVKKSGETFLEVS